jgi:hypothetical protein
VKENAQQRIWSQAKILSTMKLLALLNGGPGQPTRKPDE